MNVDPLVSLASSIHAGPRVFALLLGSGISKSAGVPTGWEVTEDLAGRLATLEGEDVGGDPIGWYRRRSGGDPDYSEMVKDLAPSPADRRNLLKKYFEPSDEDREEGLKTPSDAHRAVAGLVAEGFVSVIVTTNFDRLTEQALSDAGVQAAVIAGPAAAEGAMPLAHSRATVIKVHGDYLSPDFRNTVEELGTYDPAMDRLLDEVFDQYGLVVCGWSAKWDKALRNALERAKSRRFASYWLHRDPLEEEAERLITHRGAIPVEIEDADTALATLAVNVEALAEAADQRPQTTDLAVARLKKFLPGPAHWIRLHDLVAGETQAAISQVEGLEVRYISDPQESQAQIKEHVGAYEGATAALLRLLTVGTRFSDRTDHDRLWAECADSLANREMQLHGGSSHMIAMQFYPALLALYAIALGSAAADRLDPIAHTLTTVTIKRPPYPYERSGEFPVVAAVGFLPDGAFLSAPKRSDPTPESDHLLGLLRPAAADVTPGSGQVEDLFDEAEYLLGLAHTAQLPSLDYLCRVGRAVWRSPGEGRYPTGLVDRHEGTLIAKGVFRDAGHLSDARDAYNQNIQEYRSRLHLRRPTA